MACGRGVLPVDQDATVASQMLAWLLQESFEAAYDAWIAPRSAVDIWAYAASAVERSSDRLAGYTLDVTECHRGSNR